MSDLCKMLIFVFKDKICGFFTGPSFVVVWCVCVCWYDSVCVCLSSDPVAHFSDRSSASVSLSVFQERPHVSPCAASLVARWREGELCAVCVPPASTWPLTTRRVKVVLLQKHPSASHYDELPQKHASPAWI